MPLLEIPFLESSANDSIHSQAHMEAIFALDFISLLLSKHAPRSAETSISPHLKQMVPLGSLNVDVIKTPEKPPSTQQDISTVARGWKLESFDAAANKLLKAASRLESEVAAETKYWNQVLAVKEKGWKVCRLPRERQALGVQYGFLEGESSSNSALNITDDHSYVYIP
jgi:mediator of RNA polymerase II transcription subunit 17